MNVTRFVIANPLFKDVAATPDFTHDANLFSPRFIFQLPDNRFDFFINRLLAKIF